MIGADRRGMMAAWDTVHTNTTTTHLPPEEVASLAHRVLTKLRADGFAHLEPHQEFIRGFLMGYEQALAQKGA